MLERHELDAFLTLAEELHFGRTAELLHVSPARVSQTIAKLERRVGVPLFRRTSRRVELTAAGEALYADVRPAWTAIAEAVARTIEAGRGVTGTLRVAFVGAAAGQLLVGATDAFRKRHPDCEVVLREAQFGDVGPWLAADEVDVVLSVRGPGAAGAAQGPTLVSEKRMLAVALGHPFARRETVSVADVARASLIEPQTTLQESLTLVGAGRGVAEVGAQTRRYYPRPDVVYIPIIDAPPIEWCLMWHEDRETARVRAFGEVAHALAHSSD
jgi:DNA-binding transcriptional LysR family regulator